MKTDIIRVRVLIEGVLVNSVSSVSVQSYASEVASASFTIPAVPGIEAESLKRAKVHIFWSNIKIRGEKGDRNWPILFEGEIVGDSFTKTATSRDISFHCQGLSTYWEQVMLYYYDTGASTSTSQALFGASMAAAVGNEVINIVANAPGVNLVSTITERVLEAAKGQEPYYLIVKKIFGECLGANHFYRLQNLALKLDRRFLAPADENLDLLVSRDYIGQIVEKDILLVNGETSMMSLMKSLMGKWRYSLIHNPQPKMIEDADGDDEFKAGGLAQFLMLPDTRFSLPPKCNVIYPDSQTSLGMDRQLLMEPTRLIGTAEDVMGVQHVVYYAPASVARATTTPPISESIAASENIFPPILPGQYSRISSRFGPRGAITRDKNGKQLAHPIPAHPHSGIDLSASTGTPVYCFADGIVERASSFSADDPGMKKGYGQVVYVRHTTISNLQTRYGHLSHVAVKNGQRVKAGEVLGDVGTSVGAVGNTGQSSGPHLHFEMRFNDKAEDPEPYFAQATNNYRAKIGLPPLSTPQVHNPTFSESGGIRDGSFLDYTFLTPEEKVVGINPTFDNNTIRAYAFLTQSGVAKTVNDHYQAMLNAEFLWRRFATRAMNTFTLPFNPYPVAGFPALIVDKCRSIIGTISSISHNISVGGGQGSATTSLQIDGPRYWDEGDPYFWVTGQAKLGPIDVEGHESKQSVPDATVANFPIYLLPDLIPTNSTNDPGDWRQEKSTPLNRDHNRPIDTFYRKFLGTEAIDYQYAQKSTVYSQDDEKDWVSYNRAIDAPVKIVENMPVQEPSANTIVGQYFLKVATDPNGLGEWVDTETRRLGADETQVMVEFLGTYTQTGTKYTGQAFNPDRQKVVDRLNTVLELNWAFRG